MTPEPCWVLPQGELRRMLQRAAAGEDIDLVLVEEYVNAEVIRP